jgi:hypothetical protein
MPQNLQQRVAQGITGLEKLAGIIPGYKGYKEKEQRREADKLLRMQLARQFDEQRTRLSRVQVQLTDKGRLASIVVLERAMMKMQLLIDRLKTASYGNAGFFDAVKVREQELDALYAFDGSLADGVTKVSGILDQLADAVTKDQDPSTAANDLVAVLESLNDTFSKRQDAILSST